MLAESTKQLLVNSTVMMGSGTAATAPMFFENDTVTSLVFLLGLTGLVLTIVNALFLLVKNIEERKSRQRNEEKTDV